MAMPEICTYVRRHHEGYVVGNFNGTERPVIDGECIDFGDGCTAEFTGPPEKWWAPWWLVVSLLVVGTIAVAVS